MEYVDKFSYCPEQRAWDYRKLHYPKLRQLQSRKRAWNGLGRWKLGLKT